MKVSFDTFRRWFSLSASDVKTHPWWVSRKNGRLHGLLHPKSLLSHHRTKLDTYSSRIMMRNGRAISATTEREKEKQRLLCARDDVITEVFLHFSARAKTHTKIQNWKLRLTLCVSVLSSCFLWFLTSSIHLPMIAWEVERVGSAIAKTSQKIIETYLD